MIAIGSGGMWGKGFMAGTQTHLEFIPERTTDFIFAAFSEEFGLAGNLFLLVCFLMLVWRGLAIAAGATSLFGRLMAGAVSMIFFTYAFVNMGMVSGILPVVGVPLPFISYGGTAMVTLGLALGILMSVARAQKQDPKDAAGRSGTPSRVFTQALRAGRQEGTNRQANCALAHATGGIPYGGEVRAEEVEER
jgi:rod shape determining protein RodA